MEWIGLPSTGNADFEHQSTRVLDENTTDAPQEDIVCMSGSGAYILEIT